MRKRQTFLLTVLSEEDGQASLCGRVKVISSGKTCTFTNLEELKELIADEMDPSAVYSEPKAEHAAACGDRRD